MTGRDGQPVDWAFDLDRFQAEAISAIDGGESVLVAAPTGAGKTVVAVHGIARALANGQRAFYTSPIKALANQKYRDLGERFGPDRVGLATGDLTVRSGADVVVMTTEVLRNMLYERPGAAAGLGCVVLDEVHYLQDRFRGPVWEEVLLNLPRDVQTVGLSATVSNLDEFVAWLRSVRGPTALVVEHERPVPLQNLLAVGDRGSKAIEIVPLLSGAKLSAEARPYRQKGSSGRRGRGGQRGGGGRRDGRGRGGRRDGRARGGAGAARPKWITPRRADLLRRLDADGLAPLIWFVFSRAGCDEAVVACRERGLRFTDEDQADRLEELLRQCTSDISDDDWFSLGLGSWEQAFYDGMTSHHAGLVPALKEAVETAFIEGLISVVFATETLALGVNLPARTVVLDRMVKFNGESHELLTPLEYTQLSGRAGRRGLDDVGHAVVCWSARSSLDEIATLAASRDYPLTSAFSPNYNMVANLMRRHDAASARELLDQSFGQFQRNAVVRGFDRRLEQLADKHARAAAAVRCDRGEVHAGTSAVLVDDDELGALRPGSVFSDGAGVIRLATSVAHRNAGVVVTAVDGTGRLGEWRHRELPGPLSTLGVERYDFAGPPRSADAARWATERLAASWPEAAEGVAACPRFDEHQAALLEVRRLERDREKLERRRGRSSAALAGELDAIAEILHVRGHADDWSLTSRGLVLARVHGECEAVLAEAVDEGLFQGLDAPELGAALSSLAWEPRVGNDPPPFRWPSKGVRRVCRSLQGVADQLIAAEVERLGRTLTRRPDPGLVDVVHRWALGEPLGELIGESMTGGDFVRTLRMTIDLARQVAEVADGEVADVASDTSMVLDRGVVRAARELPWAEPDDELPDDHAD